MRKTLLIGLLIILMIPSIFASSLIQENTGGTSTSTPIRNSAATTYYATNITMNSSFILDSIQYNLRKSGSPTGNIWLEIYVASASGPTINTSRILRSNNVDVSTLSTDPTGSYGNFTFNNTPLINSSQILTVVVAGDYATSGANYVRSVDKANTGTNLIYTQAGPPWTTDQVNRQNNYQIWGTPFSSIVQYVNFTFYDEQSNNLITPTNINMELIGQTSSYQRSTTSGSIYTYLLTPDNYVIRYSASGYVTRFGYLTLSNDTRDNLTVYLLNASNATNVTATVYDQGGNLLEGALVKVLRFDINSNSYINRESILTNFEGKATFGVSFNSEYYKFIVEYPVGTVALTTAPSYITSTTFTLVVPSGIAGSQYRYVRGVGGDVTYNNLTGNFRFDWSDNGNVITQACLYTYEQEDNLSLTYLNSSCSTNTTGTLLVHANNVTGNVYYGTGIITIDGFGYYLDSEWADLRNNTQWNALGLVIAIILTVSITFMFINLGPTAIIIALPIGITLTNLLGVTKFSFWIPIALWVVSIIIMITMGRSR